jgi:hypothetical protein
MFTNLENEMANPITIGDTTFPSLAAAARHLGVTRQALSQSLKRAVEPVEHSGKQVTINGVAFDSIGSAAAACGVHQTTMYRIVERIEEMQND